ncbi:SGNH/GDSL hydrolase family protein [Gramella sp. AN32]|uniref:SGNH/GDSL hydrolase family protein n=1 Tax=Christiangramia antarctica TaxID=2058158 RepID=A0ABW5X5M2_9FLAO|nr:SGNH/GDSL hydrolase family protein [Gramella sp. AN32]
MGNSITEKWVQFDPEFFSKNNYIGRGISGQTTSQMLVRFRQDVIDLNPEVVVIHAGTNDIAGNTGPITVPEIAANIFSMVELAQAHDIKVILASVLPASSYSWSPSINPIEKIGQLNDFIKDYAKKNNVIYLDYYSAMVNDEKGLKKEYGRDTVHPSLKGYEVMAPLVKEAIKKALN